MSERPSSTKQLVFFGFAVLFVAWAVVEAFRLLATFWVPLLIVAVLGVAILTAFLWWKWRRNNRW